MEQESSKQQIQAEIEFLLKKSRSCLRVLLHDNGGHFDPSQPHEHLIQKLKTLLSQLNLEEKFFRIFNDCYLPVDSFLENSTEKLSQSNYNVFLISILVFLTIKHLNIPELSDLEKAIEIKLKEISSLNFDTILIIVNVVYPLHDYESPF